MKPRDANPADEERVKLHQTMFAYADTFPLEREKVVHHLDISRNQHWSGTDLVRFYKLDGSILTITTAPQQERGWEKVRRQRSEAPPSGTDTAIQWRE
jgi:hypothetical protein